MAVLLFIISVVLMFFGIIVKIERQSQFIEIYEKPPRGVLCSALSATYLLNLILPFKLGNIFRILFPHKHLQNGATFCFSTVIVDILLDFFTVGIVYGIVRIFTSAVTDNLIFYIIICISIIFFGILCIVFKKYVKKALFGIACIFNESICLRFLKTGWFIITSIKNIFKNVNKLKLLIYTVISNALLVGSYYCLACFMQERGIDLGFLDIFGIMYGAGGLRTPMIVTVANTTSLNGALWILLYMSIIVVSVFIFSYIAAKIPHKEKAHKYINILPPIGPHDRLVFLSEYFSSTAASYIKGYLELNRDVSVIEDFSAGSNAKTMLCTKEDKTFYRKLSIGKDADKLHEQITWIEEHKDTLPLTEISASVYENGICSYDMPYKSGAVSCFNYVHTMPLSDSWRVIKCALDGISKNLHTRNQRSADAETIENYIEKKVLANISIIKDSKTIRPLLKYEYLHINGKKYHNFPYFEKYLTKDHLLEVFKNDTYSDIHGDLTIENIICLKNPKNNDDPYYIIDPNTGNLHDSPYLDYAKLLQSIHGGYEFLMKTERVSSYDDNIDFLFTKSNIYYTIFDKYRDYLLEKFGKEGLRSIFYHELIHWLRLMPYKTNKIGERALIFYAGMIMVATDIEKWFEMDESSTI